MIRLYRRDGTRLPEREAQRLDWLIHEVEGLVMQAEVCCHDAGCAEVFQVTGSWLQTCLTRAKGIGVLVRKKLYAAVGPLHRSLWELWIDWRYLLRVGDRQLNCSKVLLTARLEAIEVADAHRDCFDPSYLAKLHDEIHEFELQHPVAAAEVKGQRRKRHYHWSGKSLSSMERALAPEGQVYGILSWEAHGVVSPLRDVSVLLKDEDTIVRFGQGENAIRPEFVLWSSGGVLHYIYNDFAEMWGLPAIMLPKPVDGADIAS
jgi:hypothetical protein